MMASKPTPRDQPTILIIEDDIALGDAFARVLRPAGYEVRLSNTAEQGLEIVRTARPAAIIVDFRMPLVNGLGFLYRLRRTGGQQTPVAVVTGDTSLEEDVKSQFQELHAHLRLKPIMPTELLALVEQMISNLPHARPSIDRLTRWRRLISSLFTVRAPAEEMRS